MLFAILAFVVFFLLAGSGLLLLFYREALGQRLASVLGPRDGAPVPSRVEQATESLGLFAGAINKVVPKSERDRSAIRKRLVKGGYRKENHADIFYGFKAILPVVLCVILVATGLWHWNPFIMFAGAIALGYLGPDFWLDHHIKARAYAINLGLADVLDLLVVCLEAGLSVDQAVLRANEEMFFTHPVLADELGLVMLEVRAGRTRVDAWRAFAERTGLDSIRMLVSILVQADQFGTGISRTLRIHSETLRTRRKQRLEELAAKTAVKLVFPLVLFIFPSLFAVTLGPAIIILMENL